MIPRILIRHTRLAGSTGRCYGRSEIPLAATFAAEAREVRASLPWRPELIWSSPASRCRALAEALRVGEGTESETRTPVQIDARLAELDFGIWEGQRWEDLKGPEVDAWMQNPWATRPPGGETTGELVERVRAFRDELLAGEAREKLVAVVTHAGVIRVWRSLAERIPLADLFAQPVEHGKVWTGA